MEYKSDTGSQIFDLISKKYVVFHKNYILDSSSN